MSSLALPAVPFSRPVDRLAAKLPGVGLCLAIALAATGLEAAERRVAGRSWLDALVLAILIGMGLRSRWTPGPRWQPGIACSAKGLLEAAVVLLGASVSPRTVLAAGPLLLGGAVAVVALAVPAGLVIGRLCGLPARLALLVACGNAICGNSAIAAVAPVIGADGEEVAASIGYSAILGATVVLGLPVIGLALGLGGSAYGAFAGLTVYAVPQVIAAAAPMGPLAVQAGTLVKLVRVLTLGPVCLALSLTSGRTAAGRTVGRPPLVPPFILGFLGLAALRSLGLLPVDVTAVAPASAGALTVVSMAALGLGVDLHEVGRAGGRVTAAAVGSLLALGGLALALVTVLPAA